MGEKNAQVVCVGHLEKTVQIIEVLESARHYTEAFGYIISPHSSHSLSAL